MKRTLLVIVFSIVNNLALAIDLDVLPAIDNNKVMEQLEAECPGDLFLKEPNKIVYVDYIDACSRRSMECLSKCQSGSADHCAGLAFNLQQADVPSIYSEKLYALGCAQGLVTACTNRAAGLMRYKPEMKSCSAKTFKLTCSEQDAWGCTMYGLVLFKGIGVTKDNKKALNVLKIGCKHGIEDEACQYAKTLEKEIKSDH